MSLFGDVVRLGAGLVPGGGTAVQVLETGARLVGGSEEPRTTICPGGVTREEVTRALDAMPASERRRLRAMVEARHDSPWTPLGISHIISGGGDCNFNTDWGRADAAKLEAAVRRYGSREPAPSPVYAAVGGVQAPRGDPTVFSGPGGAPLGVPAWGWIVGLGLVALGLIYWLRG